MSSGYVSMAAILVVLLIGLSGSGGNAPKTWRCSNVNRIDVPTVPNLGNPLRGRRSGSEAT